MLIILNCVFFALFNISLKSSIFVKTYTGKS